MFSHQGMGRFDHFLSFGHTPYLSALAILDEDAEDVLSTSLKIMVTGGMNHSQVFDKILHWATKATVGLFAVRENGVSALRGSLETSKQCNPWRLEIPFSWCLPRAYVQFVNLLDARGPGRDATHTGCFDQHR
jgi:hypothetical protein